MRKRRPIERLTIRAALLLGFGLTFGTWLAAGYYFANRIGDVEHRATAVNTRYMQAQELLSTVRAQVLLGSVYVRDALLDPNPATAPEYRRQLEESYEAVSQALEQYVPVFDSAAERERVGRLQREIDAFRRTMLQVLDTDSRRWPADARVLLRTQIVPKRELVIRVSEEIQALNRVAFVQQQTEIAGIYGATQRQLWETLGLAVATSIGIALLAVLYSGRLEDRIRHHGFRDATNAHELQRLSAKLIAAQEDERRTIARELHDEIGQVLTTIKVELAVAQRHVEAIGGPGDLLDDVRSMTEGAVTTVRDLSHLLHPALLDDLGLPAAVEWHVQEFGKRHQIRTEVLQDRMDERLAPEVEVSAYRIVQEALTNVARHAHATTCRVYLQRLASTILVTVEDNGAGFDMASARTAGARAGLGLVGVRERVSQLGGTVRLESTAGHGSRLTVELPARAAPRSAEPPPLDALEPTTETA